MKIETVSFAVEILFENNDNLTYKHFATMAHWNGKEPVGRSMFYRLKKVVNIIRAKNSQLSFGIVEEIVHSRELDSEYAAIIFDTAVRHGFGKKPDELKEKMPKSTKKQLKSKIKCLEKELDLLDEICDIKNNENNELQKAIEKLHKENNTNNTIIKDLHKLLKGKTELESEIKTLRDKYQAVDVENYHNNIKITGLEARIDELLQAVAEREADIAHYKMAFQEVKNILSSYESKGFWKTVIDWFKK